MESTKPARPTNLLTKRLFDTVSASTLLLVALPIMAAIAVVIAIDSPGSFLFSHERIGRFGKRFRVYKFRTLITDAPRYSYKLKTNDVRVTGPGRFLRLTGLDELPQLVNVIKGDMSLVGPRPELPFIVEQYEDWQHERHHVRPGLTGWWQIHFRNEEPMHLRTDYDVHYVRNLSWRLDALILAQTVKIVSVGVVRALRNGKSEHTVQQPQSHVQIDGRAAEAQELG
ncbi:MAG TPA: sugar transferase [Candidatus Dormibacteraeota bacterium]|nr:sugar transferase [Candidatus Dormibacteraeota bacterium]